MSGAAATPATSVTASPRQWLALSALCLSLLIVSIDNNILNVAIPSLVHSLGATPSQLQWIVDSYTLVFAGLLLLGGNLGDRFGRRGVLTTGLVIFGVSSLAASLATSPLQLIIWRAVMGSGAALIMPATLSILVNVFVEERLRRRAIAYWSLMNAAGAFAGPVAGGLLLRSFWWGSCFLVNVPVVIAALVLQRLVVPTSRNPAVIKFDLPGAALSTAALAALLWAIIEGPSDGWTSVGVVAGFCGFAVLGLAFVLWERRTPSPMIDIAVFRNPQLTGAAVAMTIAFITMGATMFLILQSLQLVKGYTPLTAAVASSGPITVVNFLLMPRAPRLTERFGVRRMVIAGMAFMSLSSLVIAMTTVHSGYLNLFLGFVAIATGFSVFIPAGTEAIMTAAPQEMSGAASAINQMTRQFGQALGVAVGGSIAASGYHSAFSAGSLALPAHQLQQAASSLTGALGVAQGLPDSARTALLLLSHQAFMHGVRLAVVIAAIIGAAGALFAALVIPSRAAPVPATERPPDAAATGTGTIRNAAGGSDGGAAPPGTTG